MHGKSLRGLPLDKLIEWMGNMEVGSPNHGIGMTELTYRQMLLQVKATEAQVEAAKAETKAAEAAVRGTDAAERNAKYVFWSVIIAAIAALASATSAIFSAYSTFHVPPH